MKQELQKHAQKNASEDFAFDFLKTVLNFLKIAFEFLKTVSQIIKTVSHILKTLSQILQPATTATAMRGRGEVNSPLTAEYEYYLKDACHFRRSAAD